MIKKKMLVPVALLAMFAIAGCNENAADRETEAGMAADGYRDATQVIVWRNADKVPNVVTFCADGRAWAATLNSAESDKGRGQLLRDAEMDGRCQK